MKYILALDQGTTSSRAVLISHDGNIHWAAQKEFKQIFPSPGWVEHDPQELWSSQASCMSEVVAKGQITPDQITGIGITNQRETTIVWERKTGKPIANAIVWQDTRVADDVAAFARDGGQDRFRMQTGLPLSTYFSGLKLRWILRNVAGA